MTCCTPTRNVEQNGNHLHIQAYVNICASAANTTLNTNLDLPLLVLRHWSPLGNRDKTLVSIERPESFFPFVLYKGCRVPVPDGVPDMDDIEDASRISDAEGKKK